MNVKMTVAIASALALSLVCASELAAQRRQARMVQDAAQTVLDIAAVPERKVPAYMMREVRAIAVFPRVQKAGFVVGGQYGKGILVTRGRDGTWGSPLFLTLTGGSVGWQFGIQSVDLVLFFRTQKSVDGVLANGLTLGVDAAVAAGSMGRQAGASTDSELEAEVYSYSRSRGLFAGISLSGTTLEIDDDANAAYYGKDEVRPRDLMSGALTSGSASAVELRKALAQLVKATAAP